MEKAQLIISRNRIGTDGEGIRTLVSFAGCPLNCRYCINPHLKKEFPEEKRYTPQSLLDKLSVDRHIFLATGGGVTFSGGEPLLHGCFIKEFCEKCDPRWGINMETSLYVPREMVTMLLDYVDTWIVDIKTTDPEKYEAYTGKSISRALSNLIYLSEELACRPEKKLVVRVPEIPEYTDAEDSDDAVLFLKGQLGCDVTFDHVRYIKGRFSADAPNGKHICELLRAVKTLLAENNGIELNLHECSNTGNCSGTCPFCDMETERLNNELDRKQKVEYSMVREQIEARFPEELAFKFSASPNDDKDMMVMGETCFPDILEGECLVLKDEE